MKKVNNKDSEELSSSSNESVTTLGDIFEYSFHKWNTFQKKVRNKALRRAHKGTNWKQLSARPGYKRVKLSGTKRYVLVRQSPYERTVKKQIGSQLGRHSSMFK